VRKVIAAAADISSAFGLFVEVAAVTGARPSQLCKLTVYDLQAEASRLHMPPSRKGNNPDAKESIAIVIPPALAANLAVAAAGRSPTAALLVRDDGEAWSATSQDWQRPFQRAAKGAGLKSEVTIYALRHSSIVRRIKTRKIPMLTIAN